MTPMPPATAPAMFWSAATSSRPAAPRARVMTASRPSIGWVSSRWSAAGACTAASFGYLERPPGRAAWQAPAYDERVASPASLDLLQVTSMPFEAPDSLLDLLPPDGALAWTTGGD